MWICILYVQLNTYLATVSITTVFPLTLFLFLLLDAPLTPISLVIILLKCTLLHRLLVSLPIVIIRRRCVLIGIICCHRLLRLLVILGWLVLLFLWGLLLGTVDKLVADPGCVVWAAWITFASHNVKGNVAFLKAVVALHGHIFVSVLWWHLHIGDLSIVMRLEIFRIADWFPAEWTRYRGHCKALVAFLMHWVSTSENSRGLARVLHVNEAHYTVLL